MKGVVDESCEPQAVLPTDVVVIDEKTSLAFLAGTLICCGFGPIHFLSSVF
jgi:hypothetical protein